MTSLKAVADPTLIMERRQAITVVTAIAYNGIVPGSPRSLEKDQNILDVEASVPTVAQMPSIAIIDAMTAAPETDLVA
ncbi:hypothetical protein BPAE_0669g00040 [Botrytis paeoniae]|uniref:Uncharacterized protein n=1 Tax=Botrytis paeoniae TaxID=278948 RepID=A0A4Z1ETR1_9HELO|nr:hypothetical protein BPAE_0669g00040 [Botrytis paeoniae]